MTEETQSERESNIQSTRRGVLQASGGAVLIQSSFWDGFWPFDGDETSASDDDLFSDDAVITIRANGTEVSNPVALEFGNGVSATIDDSGENPVVTLTSSGSSGGGFDFGTIS